LSFFSKSAATLLSVSKSFVDEAVSFTPTGSPVGGPFAAAAIFTCNHSDSSVARSASISSSISKIVLCHNDCLSVDSVRFTASESLLSVSVV